MTRVIHAAEQLIGQTNLRRTSHAILVRLKQPLQTAACRLVAAVHEVDARQRQVRILQERFEIDARFGEANGLGSLTRQRRA